MAFAHDSTIPLKTVMDDLKQFKELKAAGKTEEAEALIRRVAAYCDLAGVHAPQSFDAEHEAAFNDDRLCNMLKNANEHLKAHPAVWSHERTWLELNVLCQQFETDCKGKSAQEFMNMFNGESTEEVATDEGEGGGAGGADDDEEEAPRKQLEVLAMGSIPPSMSWVGADLKAAVRGTELLLLKVDLSLKVSVDGVCAVVSDMPVGNCFLPKRRADGPPSIMTDQPGSDGCDRVKVTLWALGQKREDDTLEFLVPLRVGTAFFNGTTAPVGGSIFAALNGFVNEPDTETTINLKRVDKQLRAQAVRIAARLSEGRIDHDAALRALTGPVTKAFKATKGGKKDEESKEDVAHDPAVDDLLSDAIGQYLQKRLSNIIDRCIEFADMEDVFALSTAVERLREDSEPCIVVGEIVCPSASAPLAPATGEFGGVGGGRV